MNRPIIVLLALVLLAAPAALADAGHAEEILLGQQLVESGASCDGLTDEQLEAIGEYLMEQMHPGEAHDAMHEMMGLAEGTPEHDTFHENLALALYCGEGGMPMMGMMRMMGSFDNLGGGRMMQFGTQMMGYGDGMMGSWWGLGGLLGWLLLLGLTLGVWLWVVTLWREVFGKKRR